MTQIPTQKTRRMIRRTHADMLAARERAANVTRRDRTDDHGYPAAEAANLIAVLGGYTVPLLDALEKQEAAFEQATVLDVHVAGKPASLAAFASVTIEGLSEPVALPLKIGGSAPDGIALIMDPRPALEALMDASERATAEPQSAGEPS